MPKRSGGGRGFTLIELMMVVAILGIVASIAIPAFTMLVRRSKTAEASSNLNLMFKSAASYYNAERTGEGASAATGGYCTVDDAGPSPGTPNSDKQRFSGDPQFRALGFSIADYVYFSYGLTSAGASCGNSESNDSLYTFYANGDLDADGVLSTFALAAGSDPDNQLYHARGLHVVRETE